MMRRSITPAAMRLIQMPATVDSDALATVVDHVLGAAGSICVLDFEATAHIDFRALQRFTERLRRSGMIAGPIWMINLSAYCEEIVRFALEACDWDLFQGMDEDGVAAGPRGSDAEATWLGTFDGDEAGGVIGFDPPCLN